MINKSWPGDGENYRGQKTSAFWQTTSLKLLKREKNTSARTQDSQLLDEKGLKIEINIALDYNQTSKHLIVSA